VEEWHADICIVQTEGEELLQRLIIAKGARRHFLQAKASLLAQSTDKVGYNHSQPSKEEGHTGTSASSL
jgi:hypothetical protein